MEGNKQFAIIGVGNCGCQVANLAEKLYDTIFDCIYCNTSESDLATIRTETNRIFKIGDASIEGSGKNRDAMKRYFKECAKDMMNENWFVQCISSKKHVFVIGSTAGGSGSGASLVLAEVLRHIYSNINFIPVGVMPGSDASLLELVNTLDYLNDLYEKMDGTIAYMLYDNSRVDGKYGTNVLEYVNREIVEDLRVLTGVDNFPTPYDSIDGAERDTLLSTPGRIVVNRLNEGLGEKDLEDGNIDDAIIRSIKRSVHVETDRNKVVTGLGVITYLTPSANKLFNSSIQGVKEFIGEPIDRFNHYAINPGDEKSSFIYLIATGLSPINDKAQKISEKADALKSILASRDANKYKVSSEDLNNLRVDRETSKSNVPQSDLESIIGKFM